MASTSNHGPIPISSRTAPLLQPPIGHRGPLTSNPLCQLDVSLEPLYCDPIVLRVMQVWQQQG